MAEVAPRDGRLSPFRAISAMDEEAWVATHARGAIGLVPTDIDPIASHVDRRRYFRALVAPFEHIEMDLDNVWPAPDGAAVKWTARAVARNGQDVTFEGVDVFEVDDRGRIRTVWSYWDPNALPRTVVDVRLPDRPPGSGW